MRRFVHWGFFAFLVLMIGAQGVFAGTTLCREASGEITLEWSVGGRCQDPSAPTVTHCLKDGAEAAAGHCMQCFDAPLPSEKSAKSLSFLVPSVPPLVVETLADALPSPDVSASSATRADAVFDGACTVRLLI